MPQSRSKKVSWWRRLLHIEPGVARAQWVAERLTNNWTAIVGLLGLGSVSWLASAEAFMEPYGTLGIVVLGVVFGLFIWIALTLGVRLFASARRLRAEASVIEKWGGDVESVNPLDAEFHRKRVRFTDLVHPVTNMIENKRFYDCDLLGPANIILFGTGEMAHSSIVNCDFVMVANRPGIDVHNAILVKDCWFNRCMISKCTVFLPHHALQKLMENSAGEDLNIITLTGDPIFDGPGSGKLGTQDQT